MVKKWSIGIAILVAAGLLSNIAFCLVYPDVSRLVRRGIVIPEYEEMVSAPAEVEAGHQEEVKPMPAEGSMSTGVGE